jgi:hypothetical protein
MNGARIGAALVAFAAAGSLVGCAGNPEPGENGYPYNLNGEYDTVFLVQGMPYSGTISLSTGPGGAVTGNVRFDSPVEVTGSLDGSVRDSTLLFESLYERDMGCRGTVIGEGTVAPGGAAASGAIEVADACGGGVMEGTFEASRPDAP